MNELITVTLKQAAQLMANCPENRFFLKGEPGIGKSSVIEMLEEITGYQGCYIDCANLELGDAACPMPNKETKTLEYYINSRFGIQDGKPVIIMLDEFTKASDPVKNTLHPMLEIRNPRLGNLPIPKGSIVFMTGNHDSDGVGDSLKAHSKMRITTLNIRKPNAKEWLTWAADNKVSGVVMAWVDRNAFALASYLDGDQQSNQYIYQPHMIQDGVVTPRTLELASNLVNRRDYYDSEALHAALCGTIGASAATSIASFIRHQDALPSWTTIIENPSTARVPEEQGALAVLVYGALERIARDNVTAWMTYMDRIDLEWQFVFNSSLARTPRKQAIGFTCQKFTQWCALNADLI